jgi:hypothetical protein
LEALATALVRGNFNRVSVIERGVLFWRARDAKVVGIVERRFGRERDDVAGDVFLFEEVFFAKV